MPEDVAIQSDPSFEHPQFSDVASAFLGRVEESKSEYHTRNSKKRRNMKTMVPDSAEKLLCQEGYITIKQEEEIQSGSN